jgi:hypothetical protein
VNYEVNRKKLKRLIFVCSQTKEELSKFKKINALTYIKWGEEKKFNKRPTTRNRTYWYFLPDQKMSILYLIDF